MNSKRIGVSFLLAILMEFLFAVGVSIWYMMPGAEEISITANLILAQMINVLPLFLVILIGRRKDRSEKFFRMCWGLSGLKFPRLS